MDEARRHMLEGIALLERREFAAAVPHFERAVALRETAGWKDDSQAAWVMAAAHLNRSDALRGLGKPELLGEALFSVERAIAAMAFVPIDDGPPLIADRLILAWIHRATLAAEMALEDVAEDSFEYAECLLDRYGRDVSASRAFLDAMFATNRARFRCGSDPENAWREAMRAKDLLDGLPAEDEVVAARVRVRAVFCRAMALMLERLDGRELPGDWIAAATDAAEEALAWARRGERESWLADLVRYGALIYRRCQPQFLGEFLCDWLAGDAPFAGDAALVREMRAELLLAEAELREQVLAAPQDDGWVRGRMEILRSLRLAAVLLPVL